MKTLIKNFNESNEVGSSILEYLLVLALISLISPIFYKYIKNTSDEIKAINIAKKIVNLRSPTLNFIRIKNENWEDNKITKISLEDIKEISDSISYALVYKYSEQNYKIINLYLIFKLNLPEIQLNRISKSIGNDSDLVKENKTFYIDNQTIEYKDLSKNELVYKVKLVIKDFDLSKYLHKKDTFNFNRMERNLDMGNFSIFNIGTLFSDSIKTKNINSKFINSSIINTNNLYFINGCFVYPNNTKIKQIDIKDDLANFRNINLDTLNSSEFSLTGKIVSSRITIKDSLNIGNNMKISSLSKRTLNTIEKVSSHSLNSNYVRTNEIHFLNGYGINVSYELILSNRSPLQIGRWQFKEEYPIPTVNKVILKTDIPKNPNIESYSKVK